MKGFGKVHELRNFLAGGGCPTSAVGIRIARHKGDRPTDESGKSGDHRAAILATHFEERTLVNNGVDDWTYFIDFASVTRNRINQPVDLSV